MVVCFCLLAQWYTGDPSSCPQLPHEPQRKRQMVTIINTFPGGEPESVRFVHILTSSLQRDAVSKRVVRVTCWSKLLDWISEHYVGVLTVSVQFKILFLAILQAPYTTPYKMHAQHKHINPIVIASDKASSDDRPFFSPKHFPTLCLPSRAPFQPTPRLEELPLSFRFLSASHYSTSQAVFRCEWVCISDIIHPSYLSLTVRLFW